MHLIHSKLAPFPAIFKCISKFESRETRTFQRLHFQGTRVENKKNDDLEFNEPNNLKKTFANVLVATSFLAFQLNLIPEATGSEVLISNEAMNSVSYENSSTSSTEIISEDSNSNSITEDSQTKPPGKVPASVALGVDKWERFRGEGFAVRVPPGFENITPVEEIDENLVKSTLQSDNTSTPFAARFSSPDGNEIITVVVRPTTQIKLSFLEIKDVKDFGSISDASSLFIPSTAKLIASREFKSSSVRVPKTYYLYEFISGENRVAMSVAVHKGKTYVLGATSPKENWRFAAGRLRAVAGAFALVV